MEVVPRDKLREGTIQDQSNTEVEGLFKTEASLTQKSRRCPRLHDQPGSSSLVALPSSIPASCYHFWMLAREEERNVESSHLPLKGMTQKLHKSLLTSHWTEHNHMTILTARGAGKCSLHMDGPVPIPGL